jgi:hypothetical protein
MFPANKVTIKLLHKSCLKYAFIHKINFLRCIICLLATFPPQFRLVSHLDPDPGTNLMRIRNTTEKLIKKVLNLIVIVIEVLPVLNSGL